MEIRKKVNAPIGSSGIPQFFILHSSFFIFLSKALLLGHGEPVAAARSGLS
jgi:hypothetical protein